MFRCTALLVTALLVFSLPGCRETETGTLPRASAAGQDTASASGDGAAGETVSAEDATRSIIPPKDPITLTFIGDIMAHKNNYSMPDYNDIYKDIKDLFLEDDLTFGNLEFPVCEDLPMSTFPAFNVHPPYVAAAINAGIEIFSCANNHTTDKGPNGIKKTYAAMQEFEREHGIYFSGIRKDLEKPYRAEYILYKRWEIGFLAATEHLNTHWGSEYVHIVDYHDEEVLASFLELLREETGGFDLFILSFHGGREYRLLPMKKRPSSSKNACRTGWTLSGPIIPMSCSPGVLKNVRRVISWFFILRGISFPGRPTFSIRKPPPGQTRSPGKARYFRSAFRTWRTNRLSIRFPPFLLQTTNTLKKEQWSEGTFISPRHRMFPRFGAVITPAGFPRRQSWPQTIRYRTSCRKRKKVIYFEMEEHV